MWLAVSNLATSRTGRLRYEWTGGRVGLLVALRPLMGEVLMDQLPVLLALKRRVEEVGMGVGGGGGGRVVGEWWWRWLRR